MRSGLPQPPRAPLTGRREYRTQINSMIDLDEYSAVLADIDAACRAQGVPSTTALAEYGPGQFEVNLLHSANALAACDEALRFRRIVKCVARRHGMDATFLPKPYADMAGSGLHVHVSLNDARRPQCVRVRRSARARRAMQHAAAGLLSTMADGMAIFAPLANSWRRFRPEAYVPAHRGLVDQQPRRGAARAGERRGQSPPRTSRRRCRGQSLPGDELACWAESSRDCSGAEAPRAPLTGNAYHAAGALGEAPAPLLAHRAGPLRAPAPSRASCSASSCIASTRW